MRPPETLPPLSDIDTLHMAADDLRAFPDRRNTMTRQVAEDLTRLATAAEAPGTEWSKVLRRQTFDDALDFLAYAIAVAEHRGTPEQVAQRTAARAILRRLKEAQRAPRDTVGDWDPPTERGDGAQA
jgi:hypothetical protein